MTNHKNQLADLYSIHTVELGLRLCSSTYDNLISTLIKYSQQHNFKYYTPANDQTCLIFDMFRSFGFTYCYTRKIITSEKSFCSYCFYMIINPRRLLHMPEYNYICITPPEKLACIIPNIIHVLTSIGIHNINFDSSLFIKRLDFCTNIKLQTTEETTAYMRLLCKGRQIYNSRHQLIYSQTGKRYISPTNHFTITGNTFELSIYSKKDQMESSPFSYPYQEQILAENQIRIELRIFYPKLASLKRSSESAEKILEQASLLSSQFIPRYLKMVYGKGDFYKFGISQTLIEHSSLHYTTKMDMVKFMKKVSKTSFQKALDWYLSENSDSRANFLINKFNEYHISPITINQKSPYEHLPHPLYYINRKRQIRTCRDTL